MKKKGYLLTEYKDSKICLFFSFFSDTIHNMLTGSVKNRHTDREMDSIIHI
jgi:hypothetical protein